jgi:tRNA(adenine34) deaminase
MNLWKPEDEPFMREAITEAMKAEADGDIPVGAVIEKDGVIIARAGNARKLSDDPTAHAEVLAIREAAKVVGNWRLEGCTLYVTLEPCTMCAGALVLSRLKRVVYGATDPKAGAVESLYTVLGDTRLNHNPEIAGGLLAEESALLLRTFFRARRGKKKAD